MDLFDFEERDEIVKLHLQNGDIYHYPNFFPSNLATSYFKIMLDEINWQQDDIKVFGKIYKQPRLTALYGDEGASYSYSGITMFPKPFNSVLKEIKDKIEVVSEVKFTTVLLNLYRNGTDSNGWHSDDEKELGQNPEIASISFGAKRVFQLRSKKDKSQRINIELEHGSLLLMKGTTQHYWQHCIPKSKKVTSPRINLTFRNIK